MEYSVIVNGNIPMSKAHDLYHKNFKADDRFTYVKCPTITDVAQFITEHIANSNMVIIFYYFLQRDRITGQALDFIGRLDHNEVKAKIVFFTNDFWYHPGYTSYNNIVTKLYTPKNHYVISFAEDMAQLETFHRKDYSQYTNKFIFTNIWTAYDSAFVEFNTDPIIKIAVSGAASGHYPERQKMLSLNSPDIVRLPLAGYNEIAYTERLNKYICSFSSSPHVTNMTTMKRENVHLLVLKYFEILASGSLLLCPQTEQVYLNRIGIVDRINCVMCDMADPVPTIKYILSPDNRAEIHKIRQAGQALARSSLNSENKYRDIMNKLTQWLG